MSYIATGVAVGGLVLSAYSTFSKAGAEQGQGRANNEAMQQQAAAARYRGETNAQIDRYKADVSDFNAAMMDLSATMDEQKAVRIEGETSAQADIISRSTTRAMGRITAAYGGAGVTGDSGSALAVAHDAEIEGTLQRQLTIYGGKVAAADARYQGVLDKSSATMQRSQSVIYRAVATQEQTEGNLAANIYMAGGQAAEAAGNAAAGTTLLTGAGRTLEGAGRLAGSFFGGSGGGGSGDSGVLSTSLDNSAANAAVATFGTVTV